MKSTFQIFTYYNEVNVDFSVGNNNIPSRIEKKNILIPFIDTKNQKLRVVSIDCLHSEDITYVNTPIICSFDSPEIFNANGAQTKIYFTSKGVTSFNDNFYLNKNISNNQNIEFVLRNVDLNYYNEFIDNFKYFLMNIEIC